jgi:hypothetical protein
MRPSMLGFKPSRWCEENDRLITPVESKAQVENAASLCEAHICSFRSGCEVSLSNPKSKGRYHSLNSRKRPSRLISGQVAVYEAREIVTVNFDLRGIEEAAVYTSYA